jgi:hypothetical protein
VSDRIVLIACMLCAVSPAAAQDRALRDPMQPFVPTADAAGVNAVPRGPRLTGVFISANRRVAVIDGELYREGDEVRGLKIIAIEPNSVSLRRGNEAVAVHLSTEGNQAATHSGDPRP